ncbi:DNA-binding NtrC family response regulator [Rhodopirellula rubra]|uniref:DNA-binding NtrC family response regulator n=1 Tax=Aporhodopirellula rubra TaxID=980271 RepID=A0A7W5H589_9BACT|nr:sigma-54-dependent Fis family transcriptional regulator [Aporhodopirellula rubra]MBB3205988.1 DNA-binding NtrC family response regulator [Aporhodopirellula rubra]
MSSPVNHAGPAPGGQLSDDEIIVQKMPLLLGLLAGAKAGNLGDIRCGVVSQNADRWQTSFWTGDELPTAHSLASEAIDRGEIITQDAFSAVEVESLGIQQSLTGGENSRVSSGNVTRERSSAIDDSVAPGTPNVALMLSIGNAPAPPALLRTLAVTLGRFLVLHRDRQNDTRRLWQTSTMLQNAAQWQQLDDDDELLESVAQCACEVLSCERATIFLWDKSRRRLIGRPAIGIEGGVLEVEDDAGIVGEVLQSGSPRWWSAGGNDGGRVNRRIDQAQNFNTHSLLAVPMVNSRDQIIGVFEAINANPDDHRSGAFDAPDVRTLSELALHAVVAIDSQRTRVNLTRTRDRLVSQAAESNPLIGNHESIRELRTNATKVAPTDLSVLVLGQNGTGKEVLAQHIHYQSERRNGPFVAVNCAALVESLLESELFGHEKGAYTDASSARQGKFELANGGTLFLDEVGDMSPGGQAKLLRVLEERVVVRVGGSQPIPVDTRVIAATNQPLQDLIAAKRFREDLFFRLNVVSLTLPPLSSRGSDVMLLAEHFLDHFCRQIGRAVPKFDETSRRAMIMHPWPGNVRELRNTIERVCYLTTSDIIHEEDLMLRPIEGGIPEFPANAMRHTSGGTIINLNEATREFQIAHIEAAIMACGGNMTDAASKLGLHRSNLYRKMRQLGMSTSE